MCAASRAKDCQIRSGCKECEEDGVLWGKEEREEDGSGSSSLIITTLISKQTTNLRSKQPAA